MGWWEKEEEETKEDNVIRGCCGEWINGWMDKWMDWGTVENVDNIQTTQRINTPRRQCVGWWCVWYKKKMRQMCDECVCWLFVGVLVRWCHLSLPTPHTTHTEFFFS